MSLKQSFYQYQAQTTNYAMGFEVDYAKGSYIYGKDGKAYLDFVAGVSANTLGHCNPAVNKALKAQIDKHLHVMVYGEYVQATPVNLCELLANHLPEPLQTTYLVNSGAEAIEGALKLAKRYTGRSQIISMKNSYHGNTHGALSVSGNEHQKRAFRPLLPDVHFIDFNNPQDLSCITTNTAAVITETIQGAAGFVLPTNGYLTQLKAKCQAVGALLILDEIQPAFGRTGKLFAFEHYQVIPDILVLGKGMANGIPIGSFTASYDVMKCLRDNPKLGHITTFGGNPVVAAAALATLQELVNKDWIKQVAEKEKLYRKKLKHPKIKQILGKGLMLALELPNADFCQEVAKKCMQKGLVVFWLLYRNDCLRITPPLTISKDEIIKGCDIIVDVLDGM